MAFGRLSNVILSSIKFFVLESGSQIIGVKKSILNQGKEGKKKGKEGKKKGKE
jgi:hypothetical protein